MGTPIVQTAILLANTEHLFHHIYAFEADLIHVNSREDCGASIAWTDVRERREDFARELVNTVTGWVYSSESVKRILATRLTSPSSTMADASAHLTHLALSKFRPHSSQGQLGELLLFNFLQHQYRAAPLLRKQPLTTSRSHERFGADAIHVKVDDTTTLFLGEAKCYTTDYRFNKAVKESVCSILDSFQRLDSELDLYIYDEFVDSRLQAIANAYKEGTLTNVRFELVCLVAYNEHEPIPSQANTQALIETEITQLMDGADHGSVHQLNSESMISR